MKNNFLFVTAILASSIASAAPLKKSFCFESGYFITKTDPAETGIYQNDYASFAYGWNDQESKTAYKLFILVNLYDKDKKIDRYSVYLQKVKTEGDQKTASLNYTGINKKGEISVFNRDARPLGTSQTERIEVAPGKTLERTTQGEGAEIVIKGVPMRSVWRNVVCENTTIEKMPRENALMNAVANFAAQLDPLFVSNRAEFASAFDKGFDAKSALYKLWKSELPPPPPPSSSPGSASGGRTAEEIVDQLIKDMQRERERRENIDRLAEKIAEEIAKRRGKH